MSELFSLDEHGNVAYPGDPEAPDMHGWTPANVSRYEAMLLKWGAFHAENPDVYRELRRLALDLYGMGRIRYGMKGLFEVVRWHRAMATTDEDFKLNNNYTAFYARLLMADEPRLGKFFELREQISERRS